MRPWPIWMRAWRRRDDLGGWMIPFWLLAADILGLTLPYLIVNRINDARDRAAFDPELALDRSLPFVDWAILAYGSFYLYYVLAAVIARSSDAGARRLIVMHQTLMMLTWGILIVMLLLPVEVDLRDQVDPRPIFQPFFDALYSADSAWNAWPSLHIVHALLIVLTADLSLRARHRRPLRIGIWVFWTALASSVMLVKQHYVFDVLTGVLVAVVAWRWWLRPALGMLDEDPDILPIRTS